MENRAAILSALEWYVDAGVTTPILIEPNNRFSREIEPSLMPQAEPAPSKASAPTKTNGDLVALAQQAANTCTTLDELRAAILTFDAHPLKKLATNMVFSDGNPNASVMVIGDPPATDEDRNGQAYCGADGQLLDKIFECIGLSRASATPEQSVYLTHILNWRPPGNRTPTDEEIALSVPFVQKHIELIAPKYLVILGGLAAKALLQSNESMSRIRGQFHAYGTAKIPTLTTYPPAALIATPLYKRKVWEDMLALKDRMDAV